MEGTYSPVAVPAQACPGSKIVGITTSIANHYEYCESLRVLRITTSIASTRNQIAMDWVKKALGLQETDTNNKTAQLEEENVTQLEKENVTRIMVYIIRQAWALGGWATLRGFQISNPELPAISMKRGSSGLVSWVDRIPQIVHMVCRRRRPHAYFIGALKHSYTFSKKTKTGINASLCSPKRHSHHVSGSYPNQLPSLHGLKSRSGLLKSRSALLF